MVRDSEQSVKIPQTTELLGQALAVVRDSEQSVTIP